jgi:AcrR family transcriptional regulator
MPTDDTKTRILDSAEALFAGHGFAGTSLRAITGRAEVNLAAVHYHFGSKEELLAAVLRRVVDPANRERLLRLDAVEADPAPITVEAILEAFIAPDLRLIRDLGARGVIVSRFLARSSSEPSELVQRLIREQFGRLGERFHAALCRALPHHPPDQLYERLMWVVAAITTILAGTGSAASDRSIDDPDALSARLVAFAAAGMRAPAVGAGARKDTP